MMEKTENRNWPASEFRKIFLAVSLLFVFALIFSCKDSNGLPRNKNKYSHADSLKANLIDPAILLGKAQRYISNYYIKEAIAICNEIIDSYTTSKDSLIVLKAFKLNDSIDKLINTTTEVPKSVETVETVEKTPRQIEAEFIKNNDYLGLYKYFYGRPDKESDFVSGSMKIKTLTWYCANGKYRTIDFEYLNGIWLKQSEYTSECIK